MPTRLARLGVLVVAAAFVGYWALLVYCDLSRPLPPGLILSFDAGRVAVVDVVPGSAAARAGLEPGDLLSTPGQPINGRLHWMAIGANFEIGRPAELPIDRHGRNLTVTVTPEPESWLDVADAVRTRAAGDSGDPVRDAAARVVRGAETSGRSDRACRLGAAGHDRGLLGDAAVSARVPVARTAAAGRLAPVDPLHEQRGARGMGLVVLHDLSRALASARVWPGWPSGCRSCRV